MIADGRTALAGVMLMTAAALAPAGAEQKGAKPAVAVFDLELIDTSLDGQIYGTRPEERRRLAAVGEELRRELAASGTVRLVDIAPVEARARAANLQGCGGCDADLAAAVGADVSITGTVQKVSNLILNMSFYVRDVATGRVVAVNADMRGNTDESWSRAVGWLVRNRLLDTLATLRGGASAR